MFRRVDRAGEEAGPPRFTARQCRPDGRRFWEVLNVTFRTLLASTAIVGLAALAILFEVGALPLLRSLAKWATERLESRAGGGAAAAPEEGASESWMDEQEVESP